MSTKNKDSDMTFTKHVVKGVIGALILIIGAVIWALWEPIYKWFHKSLFPNAPEGTLILFQLFLFFPFFMCGIALLVTGGYQAYKIAAPKEEEE